MIFFLKDVPHVRFVFLMFRGGFSFFVTLPSVSRSGGSSSTSAYAFFSFFFTILPPFLRKPFPMVGRVVNGDLVALC